MQASPIDLSKNRSEVLSDVEAIVGRRPTHSRSLRGELSEAINSLGLRRHFKNMFVRILEQVPTLALCAVVMVACDPGDKTGAGDEGKGASSDAESTESGDSELSGDETSDSSANGSESEDTETGESDESTATEDGLPEDDADNDGVADDDDNCVDESNLDQADFDSDGIGDGRGVW